MAANTDDKNKMTPEILPTEITPQEHSHEHDHEQDHTHEHTHEHEHEHTHEHEHNHEEHTHEHAHDHTHDNDHEHTHDHGHHHSHENTRAVVNRLNRAIGHLEAVRNMVEDGRDCSEVLIQIAAVRSAINNIGKIILEDHINHCVVDAIETGDKQVLSDLNNAINKFVK